MKLGKYEALDKKEIKNIFSDYISALEIPIIDYVAIGVQDTVRKTSASLMSCSNWQKKFQELNLAKFDPVRKASFNTDVNFFAFDELDYQDNYGKEVMQQRKRCNIENGIVVMRRDLGFNFMLTLATGFKNFRSHKFLIENNSAINHIFDDLICLISPSTKKYRMKAPSLSHPNDDAK